MSSPSNIAAPLRASAERAPEQTALIHQDHKITYGELDGLVDRVASGLHALGIRKGDRVAVMIQNIPHFAFAYLGIARAGGVCVPLNVMYTADEVSAILSDSEARAILVSEPFAPTLDGLRTMLPMLEHVVVVGEPRLGAMSFEQMLAKASVEIDVETTSDDLACLVYTSGTTGTPKGAMLTHGNLLSNLVQMESVERLTEGPDDVVLLVLPMFHIYALNVGLGFTLKVGATALLLERFDAAGSIDQIEKHGVTVLLGAPPIFMAWLATPGIEDRDLSSVRLAISGAAALPPAVMENFRERLGVTIWEGYGLTETSPVLTSNAMGEEAKPGSIGKPLPEVEIRILSEAGEEVEPGDPGEIVARGPNVFAGYWRQDAATKEAFRSGWFHTGDVAYMDPDGYLHIVNRKKDLIIVSGFNVYPLEVEQVLYRHPKIAEAAIVGVPHPYTGEAVKAFVVLNPGVSATEEEIDSFCRKSLARFKCPAVIEFVDSLPHTLAGKVLRRALREQSS